MKKSFYFLAIILIVSFLASCKKEPEFSSIKGRVLEKGSNKPIPNALIRIQKCTGEFLGNTSCTDIDTTYSDKDGNYSYYHELVGNEIYSGAGFFLVPSKPKYFSYLPQDYAMPTRGASQKDMILFPMAWFKIHVKAVNQYKPLDAIQIIGLYAGDNGNGFKSAIGMDYIKNYQQAGNDTISFRWTIYKDGVDKDYFKKIYLPALDTTTFSLFF